MTKYSSVFFLKNNMTFIANCNSLSSMSLFKIEASFYFFLSTLAIALRPCEKQKPNSLT